MIQFGLIFGILILLYFLLRDMAENPAQETVRFDWEEYNRDIQQGLDSRKQIQKLKSGAYNTTEPYSVVDVERFRYDLEIYGEEFVDRKKRDGEYGFLCKSIDQKMYERAQRKKVAQAVKHRSHHG